MIVFFSVSGNVGSEATVGLILYSNKATSVAMGMASYEYKIKFTIDASLEISNALFYVGDEIKARRSNEYDVLCFNFFFKHW